MLDPTLVKVLEEKIDEPQHAKQNGSTGPSKGGDLGLLELSSNLPSLLHTQAQVGNETLNETLIETLNKTLNETAGKYEDRPIAHVYIQFTLRIEGSKSLARVFAKSLQVRLNIDV